MEKELIVEHIKILLMELKHYNDELINLEKNRPLKFQKKKLNEYEKQKKIIKKHIEICNNKIKKEYELISNNVED